MFRLFTVSLFLFVGLNFLNAQSFDFIQNLENPVGHDGRVTFQHHSNVLDSVDIHYSNSNVYNSYKIKYDEFDLDRVITLKKWHFRDSILHSFEIDSFEYNEQGQVNRSYKFSESPAASMHLMYRYDYIYNEKGLVQNKRQYGGSQIVYDTYYSYTNFAKIASVKRYSIGMLKDFSTYHYDPNRLLLEEKDYVNTRHLANFHIHGNGIVNTKHNVYQYNSNRLITSTSSFLNSFYSVGLEIGKSDVFYLSNGDLMIKHYIMLNHQTGLILAKLDSLQVNDLGQLVYLKSSNYDYQSNQEFVNHDIRAFYRMLPKTKLNGTKGSINLGCYPNPSTDRCNVHIELEEESSLRLLLSDISGKEVLQEFKTGIKGHNQWRLDLTDLPKGIYIISIQGEKLNESTKIIKE